jgi:hypothetical protein
MKKLLLVLAIGSLFAVACNDGGSADAEKTADSTATPTVDTAAPAPTVDTAAPAQPVDTTKKADTTKKK